MLKRVLQILISASKKRCIQVAAFVFVVFIITTTASTAHAELTPISIPGLSTLITDSIANFFYTLQTIASWLIYLAGALLNFSINLTMNIKTFVEATPAIYTVWKAIRDIAGMFLIFSLLYAAIMLITSWEKPNFGNLIKNIVVAGVLINFSFFLTGLAIDVSNIVSLQLYSAIAPQSTISGSVGASGTLGQVGKDIGNTFSVNGYIQKSVADGGLSTIFMQSLGITRLYNPNSGLTAAGKKFQDDGNVWTGSFKIILIGTTSIIIMITAALSFFLASLAFIVRFVILLFLLAFSPIWFASFIVPEIGKYADMWKKQLKSQLIFMPVYLLLMYFALSVLTSSSIFKDGYMGSLTSDGNFLSDLMVLAVNAVLVIVMMNAPLLGAMSMGAVMPKWAEKVGADAIWKKVGSFAGAHSIGRGAAFVGETQTFKRFASQAPLLGAAASKGLSKISSAGFGEKGGSFDARVKAEKKSQEDLHKKIGTVDETKYDTSTEKGKAQLDAAKAKAAANQATYRNNILGSVLYKRASAQTAAKLNKAAEKAAKKKAKSDAEKKKKEAQTETKKNNSGMQDNIARFEADIASFEEQKGGPMGPRYAEMTEKISQRKQAIAELKKKIAENNAKLDEQIEKFDEDIRVGKEIEEEEKNEKMIAALEKKDEGGGGGGDKDKKS